MSKEVAVAAPTGGLPELYAPVHSGSDLQMSGIYVIAELSAMARARVATPGDVVLALGSDDVAPVHLINQDEDPKGTFDAYVIARDPFVASTANGDMEFLPKDYVRRPDEADVWNGYFYYLALPDVDPSLPARMMLWRTAGTPVARMINTFMARAAAVEDYRPVRVRFGVQTATGQKSRQQYWKLNVQSIPHGEDDTGLAIALKQQQMLAASQAQYTTGDPVAPDPNAASY